MRLDLDIPTYRKLIRLALIDGQGRTEPMVATVERLIQKEPEVLPPPAN